MTARDLLVKQLTDSEKQITLAIKGLDSGMAEACAYQGGMTIREQVHHLAEACVALMAIFEGRQHEWGSWDPEDRSWNGVKKAWRELRPKAVAAIGDSDDALLHGHNLLVAHDYYHVGQIAAARRTVQPDWTSYEIYE
ncbi:hypothetical protein EON82_01335 [bacterium]|nr:MAG: hypothetical protein EON82_01335 [bacterium]